MALDLYAWLAHRLHRLDKPTTLYWANLRDQFGQEITDKRTFKRNFNKALKDVLALYPSAKIEDTFGGIRILPSPPPVSKTLVVVGGSKKSLYRCLRASFHYPLKGLLLPGAVAAPWRWAPLSGPAGCAPSRLRRLGHSAWPSPLRAPRAHAISTRAVHGNR